MGEHPLSKMPPSNLEAEQMVLGAILFKNDSIKKITGILTADDFYRDAHRRIFTAMLEMHGRDEHIDVVTLVEVMTKKSGLEGVGGASYLAYLDNIVPTAANIVTHAKIVKEKSGLRKLIHLASDTITKSYAGEMQVNEIAHEVIQAAKNSRSSSDIVVVKFDKVIQAGTEHIERRQKSQKKVYGVPTGIAEIDDHTDGIYPGESWLVAARPGKGKTAFSMSVSRYAASQGFRVGMINLEMSEEQLGIRSLSSKTGIPITMLRKGMIEDRHWAKITDAWEQLAALPIYTVSTAFSTEQIEHATDILVDDYGCQLMIYDYMQLIRPGRKLRDRNREQEVAEVSGMIKHKAMQGRFAALPLAQLNRNTEQRKDKKPQLSDLRESGALEQDADNVILIYHHECGCAWNIPCGCGKRDRVDFIIEKGRNCGGGLVEATWDKFTTTFKGKTEAPPRQETYHDRY